MKKLFIIAALLIGSFSIANAQIWVNAGYDNQALTSTVSSISSTSDPMNGFFVGAEYEYGINGFLAAAAGVNADFLFADNFSFISAQVPVLARASYGLTSDLKVFAQAGPQFEIGLSRVTKSGSVTINAYEGSANRFGFAVLAGLGVTYADKYRVFFNYSIGLSDYSKSDSVKTTQSGFKVGVAYAL